MTDERPGQASEERPKPGGRRTLMGVVQILGFLGGVALLVWVILEALSPENRRELQRLGDATPLQVGLLFLCSMATLTLNGSIFWVTLYPEKKLSHLDVQATNAIATLLSYLPFKIGLVFRILIHNRRDGVPLPTIGAWYLAMGALIVSCMGPLALASVWRGQVDTLWWVVSIGGTALLTGAMVLVTMPLSGDRGLERVHKMVDPIPIRPLHRFLRTEHFERMHAGFGMLAHPWASFWATMMRLADVGAQTARFVIAAQVLGVEMSWEAAVLIAITYFMIGLISPFGMIGTREGGTVGLQSILGVELIASTEGGDPLALVVLFVSATESIAYFVGAGYGVIRLRVDKLLRRRADELSPLSSDDADRPGATESDGRLAEPE